MFYGPSWSQVKRRPLLLGLCVGAAVSLLWFGVEELYPWEKGYRLPGISLVLLTGFLALGWLRKDFTLAKGYAVGASPIVVLPLLGGILVLGFLGGLSVVEAGRDLSDRLQRQGFEAATWRQHADDATRGHMVDDLVQSRKLEGLGVQEAQALLGPTSGNLGGTECALSYWLGTRRGWLCLSSEQGRISRVGFREYRD